MSLKTVSELALRDIRQDIHGNYERSKVYTYYTIGDLVCQETWICTEKYLNTKETRKLNRRLGLHKINKSQL